MPLCRALALVLFFAFPALAAPGDPPPPWPASNITLVMPFSRGSETDTLLSLFRAPLAAHTGKTVTERFVSGQAGADAWARMQDDPANGSVLTAVLVPHIMLRTLQPDSGVAPTKMAICHIMAYSPCAIWSTNPGGFDSVSPFINAARAMAGTFPVAGPGRYSAAQIAARALDRQAGVKTLYIPYAGSVEAAKAVLNQQASLFWAHSVALPDLGKAVKPLAVAAEKRLPSLPEVPTLRELGFDLLGGVYYGIAVPLATPDSILQEISAFFSSVAGTASFREKATSLGFIPLNISLADIPALLAREEAILREAIEDYDMKNQ